MTKLIALSGIGNTGKSTLINKLKEEFTKESINALFLGEIARDVMNEIDPNYTKEFQEEISKQEFIRAEFIKEEMKKGVYDAIVCDRTWLDNFAYACFNLAKGKIEGLFKVMPSDLDYDKIILFETPIKETKTEVFEHYNDYAINQIMMTLIKLRFKDVSIYDNGKEDGYFVLKEIMSLFSDKNENTSTTNMS